MKWKFLFSLIILITVLATFNQFLWTIVETRPSFAFNDSFLELFQPRDLSQLTFGLVYSSLLMALVSFWQSPQILLRFIHCYTLLTIVRMTVMFLLPLAPPETMIILKDPFVEFGSSSGASLTRDLFFSGHTSILFLLSLIAPHRTLKTIFLIASISVGICVLLQHVHYTVDVIAAPFFAYGVVKLYENLIIRRHLG